MTGNEALQAEGGVFASQVSIATGQPQPGGDGDRGQQRVDLGHDVGDKQRRAGSAAAASTEYGKYDTGVHRGGGGTDITICAWFWKLAAAL